MTAAAAVVFAASAATTIVWCRSMPAMAMPMPGGWTMSMAWMRMPDQSWPGAAAAFLAMWVVMMPAMMLPAVLPALRRYAAAVGPAGPGPGGVLVAVAAAAYFLVWAAAGLVLYPIGAWLAGVAMARPDVSRAVPFAMAGVLLMAGLWQLTGWKAQALACCGANPEHAAHEAASTRSAWRHGLRLGARCLRCCGNLMAVVVVLGVMDLVAMAAVTAAIAAERLAPRGDRMAQAIGAVVIAGAAVVFTRALG